MLEEEPIREAVARWPWCREGWWGRTLATVEVLARSRELAASNNELRAANVKLGELDAAKTAFFNNVSHEFRTPLTLMLGPLEDSLAETSEPLAPKQRLRIELAHANALRLLKLVNALLDFSRLEAKRLEPRFAPIDLGTFTAELSGMFQSAVAKADHVVRLAATIGCDDPAVVAEIGCGDGAVLEELGRRDFGGSRR